VCVFLYRENINVYLYNTPRFVAGSKRRREGTGRSRRRGEGRGGEKNRGGERRKGVNPVESSERYGMISCSISRDNGAGKVSSEADDLATRETMCTTSCRRLTTIPSHPIRVRIPKCQKVLQSAD